MPKLKSTYEDAAERIMEQLDLTDIHNSDDLRNEMLMLGFTEKQISSFVPKILEKIQVEEVEVREPFELPENVSELQRKFDEIQSHVVQLNPEEEKYYMEMKRGKAPMFISREAEEKVRQRMAQDSEYQQEAEQVANDMEFEAQKQIDMARLIRTGISPRDAMNLVEAGAVPPTPTMVEQPERVEYATQPVQQAPQPQPRPGLIARISGGIRKLFGL